MLESGSSSHVSTQVGGCRLHVSAAGFLFYSFVVVIFYKKILPRLSQLWQNDENETAVEFVNRSRLVDTSPQSRFQDCRRSG